MHGPRGGQGCWREVNVEGEVARDEVSRIGRDVAPPAQRVDQDNARAHTAHGAPAPDHWRAAGTGAGAGAGAPDWDTGGRGVWHSIAFRAASQA